jgi:radical SAM superfamily enzyme YgiQ (UPF0313 family)
MRVVLISPKGPLYRHRGGIFRKSLRYMPLTLPTLAALVPDDLDIELRLIDEGIEDVDMGLEADLVGMTVITGTAPRAYALAACFRRRGIPVVLGGPHVTLVPEDAQPHADAIVVGYAEESWPRLLRDLCGGTLQPRYDQAPDLSLERCPFPRRDLLPRRRYLTSHVFEATRGCVHRCDFCVVPAAWGRRPYQKPVEHVVEDLRREQARRAVFVDLNLIADREYAARLFEAMIPLQVKWYGLTTTLLFDDPALLALAARSGCRGLLMGLESVSPASLRASHKGFNDSDRYPEQVALLHAHGIALQACFVFGMDADTPDIFMRTAELAVRAKMDLPRYAILTPFPGTALHARLEREGRILTRNWEAYDGQHVVFQPAGMTPGQLLEGTRAAWRHTYRWSNIRRRCAWPRIDLRVFLLTNMGYRFYARNLHRYYTCDAVLPSPAGVAPPLPVAS